MSTIFLLDPGDGFGRCHEGVAVVNGVGTQLVEGPLHGCLTRWGRCGYHVGREDAR